MSFTGPKEYSYGAPKLASSFLYDCATSAFWGITHSFKLDSLPYGEFGVNLVNILGNSIRNRRHSSSIISKTGRLWPSAGSSALIQDRLVKRFHDSIPSH
jgi:hypothetical protein